MAAFARLLAAHLPTPASARAVVKPRDPNREQAVCAQPDCAVFPGESVRQVWAFLWSRPCGTTEPNAGPGPVAEDVHSRSSELVAAHTGKRNTEPHVCVHLCCVRIMV